MFFVLCRAPVARKLALTCPCSPPPHPTASFPQTAGGVQVLADPPMHQVLPLWTYPVCSSLCSATASIVTHPIDVVKTRLQVLSNRAGSEGAGGGGGQRMTAWQVGWGRAAGGFLVAACFPPSLRHTCTMLGRPPCALLLLVCQFCFRWRGSVQHSVRHPLSRESPLALQVCRQLHAQEGLRGFARGLGARCVAG